MVKSDIAQRIIEAETAVRPKVNNISGSTFPGTAFSGQAAKVKIIPAAKAPAPLIHFWAKDLAARSVPSIRLPVLISTSSTVSQTIELRVVNDITDVATPMKWNNNTPAKTIGEPFSGKSPKSLNIIIPFSTVREIANNIIAPFLFPNLPARNGEAKIPTNGAKKRLNPIVRMFKGVNSQKKL